MKLLKLLLILSFTLFLSANIFGQAAVDIPLIATESNYPVVFQLAVGLDLTATNEIDSILGEYDLPFFPALGLFEIRFDLAPYTGQQLSTYKDYRSPGNPPAFPFSGIIQHTLMWQISSPGSPIPINITYNLPPGAIMRIIDNLTGTLLNLGPFTGQGIATIPGSYTVFASKVFLIMEYNDIVPVELTSFKASVLQNEKAVQLNWTTATETNNSGFEIQRSPSLIPSQREGTSQTPLWGDWGANGFVPGFGTTTEPKTYSFTDESVSSGTYKYRLKQIDFDGSFEYSNEIEVEVDFTPKEFVVYQNYPNPFNPNTIIRFEIPGQARNDNVMVTLKVYDILGNEVATLVNEERQPGVYEVEFDGTNLSSGVYYYVMRAGNPSTGSGQSFIDTKKFVLIR